METKKNKWLVWTENALLPLILALYPLRHVWMGIDLRDTGYNYANFRYMGLAHMDSMWVFSTYLANAVGHFFSLLPGGDTLLFMNIYTALVVSVTALIAYFFLVKNAVFRSGRYLRESLRQSASAGALRRCCIIT